MSESAKTAGVTTFVTTENPPIDLFRINPGAPCDYALEQVSILPSYLSEAIATL